MNMLVYTSGSSSPSSDRFGWTSLDLHVLGWVVRRPDCATRHVTPHVPPRLVEVSLRLLEQRGLLRRRPVNAPVELQALLIRMEPQTVWEPTPAGLALHAPAGKAA